MTNAIEVEHLVVMRGKRRVLHDLSCAIPRGSVPVRAPPAGSRPLGDKVGYLTQAPSVYADLTVRENARYFASLYGEGAANADQAITDVGLAQAKHQLVGTLSGGQRARASLACAILGH